jgi:hypothetical protein
MRVSGLLRAAMTVKRQKDLTGGGFSEGRGRVGFFLCKFANGLQICNNNLWKIIIIKWGISYKINKAAHLERVNPK